MRCRAAGILLALLAGLVITIIVAWACAMLIEVRSKGADVERAAVDADGVHWYVAGWAQPGALVWFSRREPRFTSGPPDPGRTHPSEILPWWSGFDNVDKTSGSAEEQRILIAHGWPWPSLWHERAGSPLGVSGGITTTFQWPRWLGLGPAPKVLPLRPAGAGFALDVVLYGACAWLFVFGARALRMVVRRWRGRCPQCGYPVGTSAVCTECGRSLAPGRVLEGAIPR